MAHTKRIGAMMLAAALTIVMAAPSRVCAWNSTAHQISAYIAYQNLSKEAKANVDNLLKAHPYYEKWQIQLTQASNCVKCAHAQKKRYDPDINLKIFLLASTWADDIRGDSTIDSHRDWHFMDMPYSTDGTEPPIPTEISQRSDVPSNLFEAIPKVRDELGNSSVPDATRATDLSWLIHLVGDAHQPLHCITRLSKLHPLGDLGGNAVRVRNGTKTTTLHAYWDSIFGISLTLSYVKAKAELITKTYPAAKSPDLSPKTWVMESYDQAKFVYSIAPDANVKMSIITKNYDLQAQKIASQRIATAGDRLAALLNELLR